MALFLDTHNSQVGPLTGLLAFQLLTQGLGSWEGVTEELNGLNMYKITYHFDPNDHGFVPFTCSIVKQLSDVNAPVILSLQQPEFVVPVPNGRSLIESGGGATVDFAGNGAGSLEGENVVCDLNSILLHELMHSFFKLILGNSSVASQGVEPFAVTETNKHRAEQGQPNKDSRSELPLDLPFRVEIHHPITGAIG